MKKEPLIKNLRIRLNESENHAVIELAKSQGEKTRSRIIRKMIREAVGEGPDLLKDDLNGVREAVRQVAALGRNINQISRAVNSGQAGGLTLDSQLLNAVARQVKSVHNE